MENAIPPFVFDLFSSYLVSYDLGWHLFQVQWQRAYKQHRYRNKCIATGSIYVWAFSVGSASALLSWTHCMPRVIYCQRLYYCILVSRMV